MAPTDAVPATAASGSASCQGPSDARRQSNAEALCKQAQVVPVALISAVAEVMAKL